MSDRLAVSDRKGLWRGGFTLIELLIVVAIIAILAAIAVPNFFEAQVRAKCARSVSDMRVIAGALEAYAVDHNRYPPAIGRDYNVPPVGLSTPVAYLASARFVDPFCDFERIYRPDIQDPTLARFYSYHKTMRFASLVELAQWVAEGNPDPGVEAVDCPELNYGATERYGEWRLSSNGPDRKFPTEDWREPGPYNPVPLVLRGCDIPYEPTNGTMSKGNILRTQKGEIAPYFTYTEYDPIGG